MTRNVFSVVNYIELFLVVSLLLFEIEEKVILKNSQCVCI